MYLSVVLTIHQIWRQWEVLILYYSDFSSLTSTHTHSSYSKVPLYATGDLAQWRGTAIIAAIRVTLYLLDLDFSSD